MGVRRARGRARDLLFRLSVTCVVAVRATGSYAIAAAVTLIQVLIAPRAYGYPKIYYFTERGFAAGHVAFLGGYYSAPVDQQLAIERWNRQSVPFALMFEGQEPEMASSFPYIVRELERRYVRVARIPDNEGGRGAMLIFAERSRQAVSIYEPLGAPCFVDRMGRRSAARTFTVREDLRRGPLRSAGSR